PVRPSDGPVCRLPLYVFERAFPIFCLPSVSAKNSPKLMRPATSAFAASRPLARAMAIPRSTTSLNGVSEFCAFAGGASMRSKSFLYSSSSGSVSASKLRWRNSEFIVSSDFGRKRVGEVLVGAHHVDAREVERLPGQVRQ